MLILAIITININLIMAKYSTMSFPNVNFSAATDFGSRIIFY